MLDGFLRASGSAASNGKTAATSGRSELQNKCALLKGGQAFCLQKHTCVRSLRGAWCASEPCHFG